MPLVSIDWNPSPRGLRTFRWTALVAAAVLATVLHFAKGLDAQWCGAIVASGGIIWLSGMLWATITRYIYVALTVLTLPIGLVVSFALMAAFYFGLITPMGLVFRLMGRDALERRFDPKATTYWIDHEQTREKKRYFQRF